MVDIPYQLALYRRNSSGEPYVWYCSKFDDETVQVQKQGGEIRPAYCCVMWCVGHAFFSESHKVRRRHHAAAIPF